MRHFSKELHELMRQFRDFSNEYPLEVQAITKIDKDGPKDPEVLYLLEAFAFIASGLSEQIEQSKNYYPEALISHTRCVWATPVPPCTILQFTAEQSSCIEACNIFGSSENCVQTFNKNIIHPIAITSTRYIGGLEYQFKAPWLLEISLSSADVITDGIELYIADTKLVAMLIATTEQGVCQVNSQSAPVILTLSREDEDLMPYNSHPADCRVRELLTFNEKYQFIKITTDLPLQGAIKIILPVNAEYEHELVQLKYDTIKVNCAPAVALCSQMIDPIEYNGTKSVYELSIQSQWQICSIREMYFSDPALEVEFVSTPNGIKAMIHGNVHGNICGTVWAIPPNTPHSAQVCESQQSQALAKLLYTCSDVYTVPDHSIRGLWALHVSNANASCKEYIVKFLQYAEKLCSKKLIKAIRAMSFVSEESCPVFTKCGWVNGSVVVLKITDITAMLVARVLLVALRHKIPINTTVSMRVLDANNQEIIYWTSQEDGYSINRVH